jgi:hypothetical protein
MITPSTNGVLQAPLYDDLGFPIAATDWDSSSADDVAGSDEELAGLSGLGHSRSSDPCPHSAAIVYTRSGLSVIGIKRDGSKAPLDKWKVFQSRIPSLVEVQKTWSGSSPPGVAVVCGQVSSNLECIDIDLPSRPSDLTCP